MYEFVDVVEDLANELMALLDVTGYLVLCATVLIMVLATWLFIKNN